ncbi:AAA family ATPase [Demequina maris]|uniref:AAA family ATPase n=1 Tax=Demequina maris TaxID=1638982 RepID=UPI000783E34C|nr:AAA family ATPase [Demequina maris]
MIDSLLADIRTGDWLDRQEFPVISWAVPGILPEGFGILTGPPKAGKSWCVYGIALAVASGLPAFGVVDTGEARPVLVLALEDGDRRMQSRARHLLGPDVPIPANLHYLTKAQPADVPLVIEAWLGLHGGLNPLVALDTLGRVMPMAGPGESAYQRDYRIGSALKRIADDHPGTCLLVVHHTRKAGSVDWMDSTSGTNGLNGAADFTVNLERPRNETTGVLRVSGRDVPESEFAVRSESGRWTLDGDSLSEAATAATRRATVDGVSERSTAIVAYLTRQAAPTSAKKVEIALGIHDARRYLARLAESGRVRRVERGLYESVPTVPASQAELFESNRWDKGTLGTAPAEHWE